MATSRDQRQRLLSATDRMEASNVDIDHAIAMTEDTIQVATGVMQNLEEQKSVMQRIIDRVILLFLKWTNPHVKTKGINDQLETAGRLMRKMGRRAIANKFIMAGIIIALLLAIAVVVYFKWFSGSSSSTDTTSTDTSTTSTDSTTS